jgi:uncharacterized coiled-coil protein SlyX
MNDRITELEIRVAYLEQTLAELNDVTIAQGTALEVLQNRLEQAGAQLEVLLTGDRGSYAPPR